MSHWTKVNNCCAIALCKKVFIKEIISNLCTSECSLVLPQYTCAWLCLDDDNNNQKNTRMHLSCKAWRRSKWCKNVCNIKDKNSNLVPVNLAVIIAVFLLFWSFQPLLNDICVKLLGSVLIQKSNFIFTLFRPQALIYISVCSSFLAW